MSTQTIPISTTNVLADTNATVNSIVYRDNQAGIYGNVVSGTNLITTGNLTKCVSTQSTSFTATNIAATNFICSGTITVTFSNASANSQKEWTILKTDASTTITISGVTGTTSMTTQYQKLTVISDGTTFWAA